MICQSEFISDSIFYIETNHFFVYVGTDCKSHSPVAEQIRTVSVDQNHAYAWSRTRNAFYSRIQKNNIKSWLKGFGNFRNCEVHHENQSFNITLSKVQFWTRPLLWSDKTARVSIINRSSHRTLPISLRAVPFWAGWCERYTPSVSGGAVYSIGNSNYFTIYLVLLRLPTLSNIFISNPFFKSLLAVADDKSLNMFI